MRTSMWSLLLASASLAALAGTGSAQAGPTPAGQAAGDPLNTALYHLARRTGVNILFSPDAVAGLTARPARGAATPVEAARQIVSGTTLEVVEDPSGARIVRPPPGGSARAAGAPARRNVSAAPEPVRLAELSMTAPARTAGARVAADGPDAAGGGEPAASETSEIAEIVVTAQRRTEQLKDVPISLQAVTADDLRRRAVNDTRDLGYVLPTVTFNQGVSASGATFALRGVRSTAIQGGVQPSTAMVIDGVPVFRQAEFIAELNDVEHIEVLNGPQGTLFGKNSTAGVINVVNRRPSDRREARLEALATSDEEYALRGMFNTPLADGVRLRVNGFYRDQAPLIRNVSGPDNGGLEAYGASARLAVDFGDRADMELSGAYSHTDSTYGQLIVVEPTPIAAAAQRALIGVPIGRGETTVNTDSPSFDEYTLRTATLTLNWRPTDELSFVSISNVTRFTEDGNIDVDGTPAGVNVGRGFSLATAYPIQYVYRGRPRIPDRYTYYSQELRGNYARGRLNAVGGLYFQHLRNTYATEVDFIFDGAIVGQPSGQRFFNGSRPDSTWQDTTAAVFGDVTFEVTDQIKVFGGLRYTHESIDVDYQRKNYFFNLATGAFNPVTGAIDDALARPTFFEVQSSRANGNISGRAGVQYQPSDAVNLYASYAHGYKAPAVDLGSSLRAGVDPIIKPEIADAFEVGAKLRLLDNRMALNVALFSQKIDQLQASTVPAGSVVIVNQLLNVGTLRSKGVEADFEYVVTPALRITGALTYNDATYHNFAFNCNSVQLATATCPNTPRTGFQDLEGVQVAGSPKWKYAVGATYEDSLGDTGLRYYAQVNYAWRSSVFFTLDQSPFGYEPAYGMLDAAVGLRDPDGRWEVQVFGKNLTDEFFYSAANSVATIGNQFGFITRNLHRYGGVRVTLKY